MQLCVCVCVCVFVCLCVCVCVCVWPRFSGARPWQKGALGAFSVQGEGLNCDD
jgi:hypothetical protein